MLQQKNKQKDWKKIKQIKQIKDNKNESSVVCEHRLCKWIHIINVLQIYKINKNHTTNEILRR